MHQLTKQKGVGEGVASVEIVASVAGVAIAVKNLSFHLAGF